ncbi:MAG: hypothetical protein R2939_03095 [Kofleriaceae bacterium]
MTADASLRALLAATPEPPAQGALPACVLLETFTRMLAARAAILAEVRAPMSARDAASRGLLAELTRRNEGWRRLAEHARDALPPPRLAVAQLRAYAVSDVKGDDGGATPTA